MNAAQELIVSGSLEALAADANQLYALSVQSADSAADYAWQCGQKLIEARGQVKHGDWLPWIKENCPDIHERTARRYMAIKSDVTSDMPAPEKRKALAAIWGNSPAHVANNSGENEWYTPTEFTASAREVMGGIDLDPASCETANANVQAAQFYTASDNGLEQPWSGRVWMNPPYAQPLIAEFCGALIKHVAAQTVTQACVLVNNGTETAWGQQLIANASAVCFPKSRIRFIDKEGNPSGAPLQGQMICYFGASADEFSWEFSKFGAVLRNG